MHNDMHIFSHTEAGGKIDNEDYVLVRRHPLHGGGWVALLADGQGGCSNGGLAARTACETAMDLAGGTSFDALLNPSRLVDLLERTDRAVAEIGGFTPLVALVADPISSFAVGASAGDSQAYVGLLDGRVEHLTARQRKNPPVGSGDAKFEVFSVEERSWQRLLIVSDGVWKFAGFDAVRSAMALPDPHETLGHLRRAALGKLGQTLPDDFSLISISLE